MELKVYAMAANDPSLRKHILQCNVIHSESHPALLVLPYVHMPMLNFFTFTDLFYQILKVCCTPHLTPSTLRANLARGWKLYTVAT